MSVTFIIQRVAILAVQTVHLSSCSLVWFGLHFRFVAAVTVIIIQHYVSDIAQFSMAPRKKSGLKKREVKKAKEVELQNCKMFWVKMAEKGNVTK